MTALSHPAPAASRPARSALPAIRTAEARQRHLRLVHGSAAPRRPARRKPALAPAGARTLGLLLVFGAALLLVLG